MITTSSPGDSGEEWKRTGKSSNNKERESWARKLLRGVSGLFCFHAATTHYIVDIYKDGEWVADGARQKQTSTVKCRCAECRGFFLKKLEVFRDNEFSEIKLQ